MAYYMDTSALMKLIVDEPETTALREWLAVEPRCPVSCDLVRTETIRAARRAAPELTPYVRQVLNKITLTQVTTAIFERAALLDPVTLRSLDALHLAAALDLGDDLAGMVTYDNQQAHAATSIGIKVITPT